MSKSEFWVEHPEADPLMRKMFEDGCSMSQIGAAIGCSRNAVIGKVHRLGLERFVPRATPRQPQTTRRARSPRPPPLPVLVEAPKPLLVEVVEAATLAPPPWVVGHARKQIIELRSDECRWPIGEPGDDFCFCAEPNLRGSSYCPYHDRISRERKRR
jgi:GcrA cell cycle regulator